MKTQLLISMMIVMFYSCQNTTFAQKIYLSSTGDDNNSGTIEKPVATLAAARNKAREYRKNHQIDQPVEIIALKGEYFMTEPLVLTAEDAATSSSPLVFRAEEGGKTVFYGGVRIEGFEKVNDKLWRVFIPEVAGYGWYFEQLYINGIRGLRAQTPNE